MRQLRRAIRVTLLAVLAICAPAGAQPRPPDVGVLLARLDDLYRFEEQRRPRRNQRHDAAIDPLAQNAGMDARAGRSAVCHRGSPRDQGTATLRVGSNLWNYLPRIARTIRVPPSMMLGSWMGTDFTNDDLVKESSLLKDFDAASIGARRPRPDGG